MNGADSLVRASRERCGAACTRCRRCGRWRRENLDVTVIVLANSAYQILRGELRNMGSGTPGQRAVDMLTLDRPDLDWVSLARGHGVEGARAATLEELADHFRRACARRGPYLIELRL